MEPYSTNGEVTGRLGPWKARPSRAALVAFQDWWWSIKIAWARGNQIQRVQGTPVSRSPGIRNLSGKSAEGKVGYHTLFWCLLPLG